MLRQKVQLGQTLLDAGVIDEKQLRAALAEHQQTGQKLGEILVKQSVVSPHVLVQTLANKLHVKGCHLRHGLVDPLVAKLIDREEARRLKVLPMFKVRKHLTVAMAEPQNLPTIDRLQQLTGCQIRPVLALEKDVEEFSQKYLTGDVSVDEFLVSLKESNVEVVERESVDDSPVTDLDHMVDGSPIINLVNLALLTAIRDGASDIHVEPDRKRTRIRYRIDGVLRELMNPPATMHAAIISRIKVIGKMDIAEKRLPQEGRVHIVADGREIDIRVSSIAHHPRREDGDAYSGQVESEDRDGESWFSARVTGGVSADVDEAAWPGTGDRTDGKRQDDDVVFGTGSASQHRAQYRDRRGPGGVPARLDQPDSGGGPHRPDVFSSVAVDFEAGPGRDHGGRDSRRRHGAGWHPGGVDGPPGTEHAAHER